MDGGSHERRPRGMAGDVRDGTPHRLDGRVFPLQVCERCCARLVRYGPGALDAGAIASIFAKLSSTSQRRISDPCRHRDQPH